VRLNSRPDNAQQYDQPFLVHITDAQVAHGGDFGVGHDGIILYSWVEQRFDLGTGLPVNANPARRGGYTGGIIQNPAIEPNNRYVEPGTYVYIRPLGYVRSQFCYQVCDFAPDGFVKVTDPIKNSDGWAQGILQHWDSLTQTWTSPQRWDVTTQALVAGTCLIRSANDDDLLLGERYHTTYVGLYQKITPSYMTVQVGGERVGSGGDGLQGLRLADGPDRPHGKSPPGHDPEVVRPVRLYRHGPGRRRRHRRNHSGPVRRHERRLGRQPKPPDLLRLCPDHYPGQPRRRPDDLGLLVRQQGV
jgi:hypothetical protein